METVSASRPNPQAKLKVWGVSTLFVIFEEDIPRFAVLRVP